METVTICGVGLIGGSFALALRNAGFSGRILGVSSKRSIEAALGLGVIDEGVTPENGIRQADLIYLSQPILAIIDFLPTVARYKRPGALVTDAGSTKVAIMRRALELMPAEDVLGGHPMAGKEVRGVEGAEADLFQGRAYILTPGSDRTFDNSIAKELCDFVKAFGCQVFTMGAEQHDRTISLTSHLCQMTSTALACSISDSITSTEELRSAGPALREMTRVAMSSYDLWNDIIATNREPIESALEKLILQLTEMKASFGTNATRVLFEKGAEVAKLIKDNR